MQIDTMTEFIGIGLIILTNIVMIAAFFSKLSNRVTVCENNIKVLFTNNSQISDKMEILHKIEGKLELIVNQFSLKP